MYGLLQEPICYGNVSGTSGADLLRHRRKFQEPREHRANLHEQSSYNSLPAAGGMLRGNVIDSSLWLLPATRSLWKRSCGATFRKLRMTFGWSLHP